MILQSHQHGMLFRSTSYWLVLAKLRVLDRESKRMKETFRSSSSYSFSLVLVSLVSLVLLPVSVLLFDSSRSYWVYLDSSVSAPPSSSSSLKWGGGGGDDAGNPRKELQSALEGFGQEAISDSPPLYNRSSSPLLDNSTSLALSDSPSSFNRSSSPLPVPANSTDDVVQDDVKIVNDTSKAKTERESSKVIRAEADLARARAVIKEAARKENGPPLAQEDHDYVPYGPIYRNAYAFHRSYLEMEKIFKVFVYEEGEPPLFHDGPCRSIYSSEGRFIHDLESNPHFRTRDHRIAHVYFLPFSVVKMVSYLYKDRSFDINPIKQTVQDYINIIANRYPYWNRSLGVDHFMLSCHDWGPQTSAAVPHLFNNSIRVLCNANSSEGFNPSKDASLPEINLRTGSVEGLLGGPSPSRRPYLGFFAGGMHGPIRPLLLKHWKDADQDLRIHEYLPKGISYYDMMRKSQFCICPSGYEVASPRIVEALYTECVPVIISDHYVLPFSDVLNWKSFSVQVQVSDIPRLKSILMGISQSQYTTMQRRVKQVQRHFVMNNPPKRYDVFHMILHSVWLRRLNSRITDQSH